MVPELLGTGLREIIEGRRRVVYRIQAREGAGGSGDLLADAHDGVAAVGGVAGAVASDAADASLFRKVAIPAIQNLREHATTWVRDGDYFMSMAW